MALLRLPLTKLTAADQAVDDAMALEVVKLARAARDNPAPIDERFMLRDCEVFSSVVIPPDLESA